LSKEELIETTFSGNLLVKELIQTNNGLTTDHLIETKLDSNFTKLELVQQGDNNMLTRLPVQNQFVSPKSAKSDDVLVNLITSVNFLGTICPKSCVIL